MPLFWCAFSTEINNLPFFKFGAKFKNRIMNSGDVVSWTALAVGAGFAGYQARCVSHREFARRRGHHCTNKYISVWPTFFPNSFSDLECNSAAVEIRCVNAQKLSPTRRYVQCFGFGEDPSVTATFVLIGVGIFACRSCCCCVTHIIICHTYIYLYVAAVCCPLLPSHLHTPCACMDACFAR